MFKTIFDNPESKRKNRFTGSDNLRAYYRAFPDKAPAEYLDEKMYNKYASEGITIVAGDTETTGLDNIDDYIVQFSAIKYIYKAGQLTEQDQIDLFIKQPKPVPDEVAAINHITNEFLATQPNETIQFKKIKDFMVGCDVFAAYNEPFDYGFIDAMYERNDDEFNPKVRFDIMQMVIDLITIYQCRYRKLGAVATYLGIPEETEGEFHNALFDIKQSMKVFLALQPYYDNMLPYEGKGLRVPKIERQWFWVNTNMNKMQRSYYQTDCGRIFFERFDRAFSVDEKAADYKIDDLDMEAFAKAVCRYHRVSRVGDLAFLNYQKKEEHA